MEDNLSTNLIYTKYNTGTIFENTSTLIQFNQNKNISKYDIIQVHFIRKQWLWLNGHQLDRLADLLSTHIYSTAELQLKY